MRATCRSRTGPGTSGRTAPRRSIACTRVGYQGRLIGEAISETYESELETLAAWMEMPDSRAVILDRRATQMGFDWYQEPNGKIWWTLVMGQG
jgi:uncharacterized protein YkwD